MSESLHRSVADGTVNVTALLAASGIPSFLHCETSDRWTEVALDSIPLLLVDHANCEKKAASAALQLLYRYTGNARLLNKMSRLAREELRHFEQVLGQMGRLNIAYENISAARYAASLHREIATAEPARLVDTLLVGAYIEARSCERFASLVPALADRDSVLSRFYESLLKSEARHYRDYLALAKHAAGEAGISDGDFAKRLATIGEREAQLVSSPDAEFRFHSGAPV